MRTMRNRLSGAPSPLRIRIRAHFRGFKGYTLDADVDESLEELPAESESEQLRSKQQAGPSGLSILEALKSPKLSELTRKRKSLFQPTDRTTEGPW